MKRMIDRIIDGILVVLILAMTVVIFISVFLRYVLNNPQSWTDEVSRIMIAWLSFLGAYMALREGKHIGFDLLVQNLPVRVRAIVHLVGQAFVLVFLAVMIWQGVVFSRAFLWTPMEYTGIPLGIVAYSAITTSGLLLFAQMVINMMESARALFGRKTERRSA